MEEWDGCEDLITDHNYEYCKDVIIGISAKEKNAQKVRDIRFVRDKLLRIYADNTVRIYIDPEHLMAVVLWLTRAEVDIEAGGE